AERTIVNRYGTGMRVGSAQNPGSRAIADDVACPGKIASEGAYPTKAAAQCQTVDYAASNERGVAAQVERTDAIVKDRVRAAHRPTAIAAAAGSGIPQTTATQRDGVSTPERTCDAGIRKQRGLHCSGNAGTASEVVCTTQGYGAPRPRGEGV